MGRTKISNGVAPHVDEFHRMLCKRIPFHTTRIVSARYKGYVQPRNWKQLIYKWIVGALRQYRNWYHADECTIIIDCELSNSLTFLMPQTFESVRHVVMCKAWDAFLLTNPNLSERRRVLRDVYGIFCERHALWGAQWHASSDGEDDHRQNEEKTEPYLEVDGHGTIWVFTWKVDQ